jgi:hypothetical protein
MANTTYFGWETPDDTDLVKDGAAAIRTLGQAIDTSLQDLEGGTTGQILSKTSNTDMDFTWITNDVGDITQVVAGTGLSGGGSSGSVTLTNTVATEFDAKGDLVVGTGADTFDKLSAGTNDYRLVAASGETTGLKYVADTQNTVVDSAGDLLYGTAADTIARLGIGTAGQVLKVNSGATAPEWATASAGALTKITSGTGTGVASITVDSAFSSTYRNYVIVFDGLGTGSDNFTMTLRTAGADVSTTNYNHQQLLANSTTVSGASSTTQSKWIIGNLETVRGSLMMTICNPQEAKATTFFSNNADNNDSATSPRIIIRSGNFSGTNQFTGFKLAYAGGGNFDGDVVVYGLEK